MAFTASIFALCFALSSASPLAQGLAGSWVGVPCVLADAGDLDQPFETPLRGWTRGTTKNLRRWIRGCVRIVVRSLATWWKWLRRTSKFVLIALVVAMFDRKLIAAWRLAGLQALSTYVPLMLYSYLYLLLDRSTPRLGKLLLAVAIAYGVIRSDMIPDRNLLPGLIDDTLVIAAATLLFVSACPDRVVEQAATRAVAWRHRALALRRSVGSKT